MGPASFLMPEDLTVAARNQVGLHARNAEWLELSRGLDREYVDADGRVVSHVTDETTNRGALEALPDGDDGRVARPAGPRRLPRWSPMPSARPWSSSSTGRRGSPTRRATPSGLRSGPTTACTGCRRRTDPDADPDKHISHIYDNRARIDTRVKLLQTGHRYSQEPASLMRRLISNIEVDEAADGHFIAESNFILAELSIQAKHEMHWWVGRTTHRLRRAGRRAQDEPEESRADQRRGAAAEPLVPDLGGHPRGHSSALDTAPPDTHSSFTLCRRGADRPRSALTPPDRAREVIALAVRDAVDASARRVSPRRRGSGGLIIAVDRRPCIDPMCQILEGASPW